MDGYPLGLGLVVEDKPTEFSCKLLNFNSAMVFSDSTHFECQIDTCFHKQWLSVCLVCMCTCTWAKGEKRVVHLLF